jgi:predicted RecB family endonuclease
LARGWAISGIGDQTREAAMAAADAAGMPISAWVERALRQALEAKAEPAAPEGVEIDELEAMVRRVVAEELGPMREALARLEARAAVPNPAGGGPVTPLRERWRQRRSR